MNENFPRIGYRHRLLRLAVLGCGVTILAGLPAAPALAADGAPVAPSQVYSRILSGIEREVIGVAEAMPADKYNFAPTNGNFKGVRTFGEQAKHMASANYDYFGALGLKPNRDVKSIDALTSKADIVQALKDSFAYGRRSIDTITPQNAFLSLGKNGATRAGMAAAAMVHCNDHYGQMVEYLRMNGLAPPATM